MLRLLLGIIFYCLAVALPASAQETFHKTIDSLSISNMTSISANPTGGYVAVGENLLPPPEMYQGLVVFSYDDCDELKWSRTIHEQFSSLWSVDVVVTEEGDILIIGILSNVSSSAFLIKLNGKGETVFFKKYRKIHPHSVGLLTGGGYFIYGNLNKRPWVNTNVVIKTDEDGNVEWSNEYNVFNTSWALGYAVNTTDGGILVKNNTDFFKLDGAGSVIWNKTYTDVEQYGYSEPLEVADGYVYCRYASNSRVMDTLTQLFKLDFNGNVLWTGDTFLGSAVRSIIQLNNGHFVAMSDLYVDTMGTVSSFVTLTELNEQGQLMGQYMKMTPLDINARVYDIASVGGNNFVVCGVEEDLTNFQPTMFISKLNSSITLTGCTKILPLASASNVLMELDPSPMTTTSLAIETDDHVSINRILLTKETMSCYQEVPLSLELGNDTTLCKGVSFTINGDIDLPTKVWSTGETTSSIEVNEQGEYHLMATNGCDTLRDTIRISYYPETLIDYQIVPRKTTVEEKVRFMSFTKGNPSIFWEYGEGSSSEADFEHTYSKSGIFPIVYQFTDQFGCHGTDTSYVEVNSYCTLFLPKAFTANGDGLNDLFGPSGSGILDYELDVFNRWGDHIFSAQNQSWDGTYKGELMPIDDYVYTLELKDHCGNKTVKKGTITLLR